MKSRPCAGLSTMLFMFAAGCGSSEMPMEPEFVTTPPPPVLTGRVLASDTFTVPPQDDPMLLAQYSSGGVIPTDVGPTAGSLLVLSIRDVSRPDFVCTAQSTRSSAATSIALSHERSDCAILVAEPIREEGYVSVQTDVARRDYFLQSNYQLLLDPEPA